MRSFWHTEGRPTSQLCFSSPTPCAKRVKLYYFSAWPIMASQPSRASSRSSTPAFQSQHATPTPKPQSHPSMTRPFASRNLSTPRPIRKRTSTNASSSNSTRYRTGNVASSSSLPRGDNSHRATTDADDSRAQADAELNEDLESLNEVIMAVDMRGRGDIGCAYYVARDETLYFMEDVKAGGAEIVDGCMCYTRHSSALYSLTSLQ